MICDIIIITSQSALAQQDDGLRAPAYRPALSVFLWEGECNRSAEEAVMADARSLRDQVVDLPSKDALIKVFGCARGFDPVAPDDVLFAP